MTQKPMDEVAVALHDCDYNVDSAVLNLLEGKNDEVMCIFLLTLRSLALICYLEIFPH